MRQIAFALALCSVLAAREGPSGPAWNVNSRYTVESVAFSGRQSYRLSGPVTARIRRMVGERVNLDSLRRLSREITGELHAHLVTFRLARGSRPNQVRVLFEVERRKGGFEVSAPKLLYTSPHAWTGVVEVSAAAGPNAFSASVLRDGDSAVQQFSGVRAQYERRFAGTAPVSLGVTVESYRDQYDPATVLAKGMDRNAPSLYATRWNVTPEATFILAGGVTGRVGISFVGLSGGLASARSESARALTGSLTYRRNSGATVVETGYSLRAAGKALGSDYAYTRQTAYARYGWNRGRHLIETDAMGGMISGAAPLFERFVLGTSASLRGWDRYELDPLGGDRMAHGTVTYGYRMLRVFYDAGSVWSRGQAPEFRDSAGVGIRKDAFLAAVAFPLRGGRVEPILIAGMNF